MQRYRYDPGHGHVADATGSYVLYSDAQCRISELEAALRDMADAARSYLHACEHDHKLDIAKCTVRLKAQLQNYDARQALGDL